jgi:hypothetical protein
MAACRAANKWLTEYEPWKMKDEVKRDAVLRLLLEACFALALFLAPLAPRAATRTLQRLGAPPTPTDALDGKFHNLKDGSLVTCGPPLFAQLPLPGAEIIEEAAKAPAKKGGNKKAPEDGGPADDGNDEDNAVSQLALVVGRIVEVWPHPDSDK